jgi:hypothetical protein
VPLCPQPIPHGPTRYQTRASAVRGRRLTAWAMARPFPEVSFTPYVTILWDLLRLSNNELDIPEWLRTVYEAELLRSRGASGSSSDGRVEIVFLVISSRNVLGPKLLPVKPVARNLVIRNSKNGAWNWAFTSN